MADIVADRVAETTTTTGTGDIALGGAVSGFRAFSSVMSVGDRCYYVIEAINGSGVPTGDWEVGYGTYSAVNTLTRSFVQKSSNSNAAVSFGAGNKRVMIASSAEYLAAVTSSVPTATGPSGDLYSGGPPAKRYWRVLCTATGGNLWSVAELQLREVVGTSQTPSGGTPLATNTVGGSSAANAFDGNNSTDWASNTVPSSGSPIGLGYDYGASVLKAIKEVAITATSNASFAVSNSPTAIQVQFSNDGVTWTTQFSVSGITWSGVGNQQQVFTDPNAAVASSFAHKYPTALAALNDVSLGSLGSGQNGYALIYNSTTGLWGPAAITIPQFTSSAAGSTPASGGGTTNFLRADGSWAAPASGGGGSGYGHEGFGNLLSLTGLTKLAGASANITLTNGSKASTYSWTASGANTVQMAYTSAPGSTPWDVYLRMKAFEQYGVNTDFGLAIRNSTSGKITLFMLFFNGNRGIAVQEWTNATTFSSGPFTSANLDSTSPTWLRINNDGTNLNFYYSSNGIDWFLVLTRTLAAFMGSVDQVGIGGVPQVAGRAFVSNFGFTTPT